MKPPDYPFLRSAGRILNAGQARTLVLSGNIHDLFALPHDGGAVEYVPLINLLTAQWNVPDHILVVYELNGPIRFLRPGDRDKVRDAWLKWRTGLDSNQLAVEVMLSSGKVQAELEQMRKTFDANLSDAVGNPTMALELLRQLCLCSRSTLGGKPILREDLIVIIEGADLLIPEGEITHLSDADRHRISICQDWFSDPGFMNGGDCVTLLAESRSLINRRVARLPQIIEVAIPAPDAAQREQFILWFDERQPPDRKLRLWGSVEELAKLTAGLSIHALMQLLKGACHEGRTLSPQDVVAKVEEYIQSQLGEEVVEFKKPGHTLDAVVGFSKLKRFIRTELIPRFRASGPEALPGAAVCGPIGGGKTFIFEAMASELDIVVLTLKNIRSKWFGETDVIFERLRRVLDALAKVVIFVDEADTQFGGVGADTHETERRLTGKIQAMMSDPQLRGRVIWLLMTARIHLLSPDIRRPGRVGDLIIPVLDPEGSDREAFLRWTLEKVMDREPAPEELEKLNRATESYSAASFASLRSELRAKAAVKGTPLDFAEIAAIFDDHIAPAITDTRRYQTLQALVNCTRRSLLPDPAAGPNERRAWEAEIRALEAKGVR
ncbi:MAG: ATP-binding protein [Candidatus Sumerlaeia bacterium]|nr:ATP-binding protein [Candidatus Sumerlaeia bacterium]